MVIPWAIAAQVAWIRQLHSPQMGKMPKFILYALFYTLSYGLFLYLTEIIFLFLVALVDNSKVNSCCIRQNR